MSSVVALLYALLSSFYVIVHLAASQPQVPISSVLLQSYYDS